MRLTGLIRKILPHAIIVMLLMILTLCILDYFNPLMGFLTRGMSKGLIVVCGISVITFVALKFQGKLKELSKIK